MHVWRRIVQRTHIKTLSDRWTHIKINHYVLFGGGYLQQSYNMIDKILSW